MCCWVLEAWCLVEPVARHGGGCSYHQLDIGSMLVPRSQPVTCRAPPQCAWLQVCQEGAAPEVLGLLIGKFLGEHNWLRSHFECLLLVCWACWLASC